MANWSKNKTLPANINGGNEYAVDDNVVLEDLNAITNNSFYAMEKADETKTLTNNFGNPNFLINGDFRVNQRGQASYTTVAKYTVDRWYIATAGTTLTPITNGVTLSGTSNNNYNLYQRIEDYTALQNKTVTFSITFANNTDRFRLRINDTNGSDTSDYITSPSGTVSVTRNVGTGLSQLRCIIMLETTGASMSIDILNAKLEVGEVATPFSPRPYAEELALCQRYFLRLGSTVDKNIGLGYSNSAGSYIYIQVPTPTTMRSSFTLSITSLSCKFYNGANLITQSLISLNGSLSEVNENICRVAFQLDGTVAVATLWEARLPANNYLSIDCEIY